MSSRYLLPNDILYISYAMSAPPPHLAPVAAPAPIPTPSVVKPPITAPIAPPMIAPLPPCLPIIYACAAVSPTIDCNGLNASAFLYCCKLPCKRSISSLSSLILSVSVVCAISKPTSPSFIWSFMAHTLCWMLSKIPRVAFTDCRFWMA